MAIPANARYKTTTVQEYLATEANSYYQVLAHNEPTDDSEEPANEKKHDKRKANDLAEAAKNENENAIA